MKTESAKTIQEILEEFLGEHRNRLKSRTYSEYVDTVDYLKMYLNEYAYHFLSSEEEKRYEDLNLNEDREFCDIFGSEHLTFTEISDFLAEFMVRRIAGIRTVMESVGRVTYKLFKWLHESGYMMDEGYEYAEPLVKQLKADLPKVIGVSDLIYDYAEAHPVKVPYTKDIGDFFEIAKIEPGKLWLKGYPTPMHCIGPVPVPREASSGCKVGWRISLRLLKTEKGWRIQQAGFIYPM